MQQPATVGGDRLPTHPIDAMHALAALGFHVFPCRPGGKEPWPGLPWKTFADVPGDPALIERLRKLPQTPNIGLICDEHLIVIDIDNRDFAAWFEAQGPERLGTWIVRTQNGGLHVYLRSVEPISTTVLKTASGKKIGDVKARGGYVVAPPSVGANGDYETEYGSPAHIYEATNAHEWFFRTFVVLWGNTFPVRLEPSMSGDQYASVRVQDPPPEEQQHALADELRQARMQRRLSEYVYVTLTEGPDAPQAQGHWDLNDRSGIDFGCVKELIGLGWTFQQIEAWYSFAPIGAPRYRGTDKSRGQGYLLRTYDNAKAKFDADQISLDTAQGGNFKILEPIERFTENSEMHFKFGIEWRTGRSTQSRFVTIPSVAFGTPQRFKDACLRQGLGLELGAFDTKDKLLDFYWHLYDVSVEQALPEYATREGQIRANIRQYIERNAAADGTSPLARVWFDEMYVYALPNHLFEYINYLRFKADPPEVWVQWQAVGGVEATWQGRACWRAPVSAFPGLHA